jgi:glutathione peroxidase-family protein
MISRRDPRGQVVVRYAPGYKPEKLSKSIEAVLPA